MNAPLVPARRSAGAFAHYRQLVEAFNRTPILLRRDIEVTEAEITWCQLTALEVVAFGIEPRLLNALALAHVRYQDLIGVTDAEFYEFKAEERAAYPEFFHGERIASNDEAAAFMALACQVPYNQALLWVARYQVQAVRSGLISETIVTPVWAYSRLKSADQPISFGNEL